MRYAVAIVFAIAAAAATSVFLAVPVASWAIGFMAFEDPEQAEELHAAAVTGINLAGMMAGWAIGWAAGGTLSKAEPDG